MLYLLFDWLRARLENAGLYGVFGVLDQVQFRALFAALLAFGVVVWFGKPVIRFLRRQKIGDAGSTDAAALREHAGSKKNTPTMGGVLICWAILLSTLLLADVTTRYVQLGVVVVLWLGVLGGFDDWLKLTASKRGTGRQGLLAWEKLVFQIGLGVIVGWFCYQASGGPADAGGGGGAVGHVLNLPFQRTYAPGGGAVSEGLIYLSRPAYVLLAVLMIAGLSNAVNITDGMDGLAAGTSAVVGVGLLLLTLIAGSSSFAVYLLVPHLPLADELSVIAGAMVGACLGFLWWNCAPAQVFMGDTGSLPLGGLIGYLAIATRQEVIVLLLCGVFLVEIGSVVAQVGYFKATRGKRIFRCAPYHHHLHLGGWTESQVVQRLWIAAVLLLIVGLASLKLR